MRTFPHRYTRQRSPLVARLLITLGALFLATAGATAAADTLATVKSRGVLKCGTTANSPGFVFTDAKGAYQGFDVDTCHAIAAAVLGDPAKIEINPLSLRDAFVSLQTGAIDVATHRATMTFNRNTGADGFDFPVILFYDGQGFMVRKSLGLKSINELEGASICVAQGTTSEKNINDYFHAHNINVKVVTFADLDEARRAYDEGRCDAWSNDRTNLAARGLSLKNPDDNVVLPETISKEPIGPMVRKNDAQWEDIVRWTLYTLIAAEELGITSKNVAEMRAKSDNPEVRRLLGVEDNLGQRLGLSKDWAYNIIAAVGNYGEMFDRNVGKNSRLHLDRGRNALWNQGGMLFAPPIR
jgi:general L-amino acid transport system substrate-binding protein